MKRFMQKIYEEARKAQTIEDAQAEARYHNFAEIVEEELNIFYHERISEIGMGINMTINRLRDNECPPDQIVNMLMKAASYMIEKSPERAFEFRKEFQQDNKDLY